MIYFGGAEIESALQALLENGVRRIQFNYFIIDELKREGFVERLLSEHPEVEWVLESGARTYMARFAKNPSSVPTLRMFCEKYGQFAQRTSDHWKFITELDFDSFAPPVLISDLRMDLLDRRQVPDVKLVPVWHAERGEKAWDEYTQFYKRIAVSADVEPSLVRRLVLAAHGRATEVHGFQNYAPELAIPIDSFSTSRWIGGQKWGELYVFQNNQFICLSGRNKQERHKYRIHFWRMGCNADLIMKDDLNEVRKANIIAWRRYSDRLEEIAKRRARGKATV